MGQMDDPKNIKLAIKLAKSRFSLPKETQNPQEHNHIHLDDLEVTVRSQSMRCDDMLS